MASALTTSAALGPPSSSTTSSARSDLPVAVGPTTAMTGTGTAPTLRPPRPPRAPPSSPLSFITPPVSRGERRPEVASSAVAGGSAGAEGGHTQPHGTPGRGTAAAVVVVPVARPLPGVARAGAAQGVGAALDG